MKNEILTIEEQEKQGLRRPASRPSNFVTVVPEKQRVLPPASLSIVEHNLGVVPTATQHIEMRTSAVDRAEGYLLETSTLCLVFSLALVLGVRYWNQWPLLSAGMYLSTLIIFAVLWGGSYVLHKLLSAEGVSLFEAKRKWDLLNKEQAARWRYYRELNRQ
jgi:hypothetical protein